MTINEAIRILDPDTSKEALQPYAYDSHQRRKIVEKACRVAVAELHKRQWISVKKRLPELDELVLVYGQGNDDPTISHYDTARYKPRGAIWWCNGIHGKWHVTHWMPLPELPEAPNINQWG